MPFILTLSLALPACSIAPAVPQVPTVRLATATAVVLPTPLVAPTQVTATRPLPTSTPAPAPTSIPTQPPTAVEQLPPVPLEMRRTIFADVWSTVADQYLYTDYHGTDWAALREEYAPRIDAAETREDFYDTLAEMVAQLGDQHSRFVPPAAAVAEDESTSGRETTVGIGVMTRPRRDGAFVQIVFPDSPAARSGLRPRDRIISVNGRPYMPEDGDLHGDVGTSVRLTVVRPGGKPYDVVIVRQEVQSRIGPYYRRFPGDIGYVSIPTLWVSDMGEQVSGALTDLVAGGDLRGLIIDVRSNRGGWGEVLSEVLSHFVRGQVGVFYGRDHLRPLVIAPPAGPDLRRVPLVVLVDNETASYAELLAAVLQREADAQIVGSHTAGNTETIYAHTFEDGSRLWLAQEGFKLQDGTNLEGIGVEPSSVVDTDWTHYSEDDDPQLLEALRLLGGGPK